MSAAPTALVCVLIVYMPLADFGAPPCVHHFVCVRMLALHIKCSSSLTAQSRKCVIGA